MFVSDKQEEEEVRDVRNKVDIRIEVGWLAFGKLTSFLTEF